MTAARGAGDSPDIITVALSPAPRAAIIFGPFHLGFRYAPPQALCCRPLPRAGLAPYVRRFKLPCSHSIADKISGNVFGDLSRSPDLAFRRNLFKPIRLSITLARFFIWLLRA